MIFFTAVRPRAGRSAEAAQRFVGQRALLPRQFFRPDASARLGRRRGPGLLVGLGPLLKLRKPTTTTAPTSTTTATTSVTREKS